MCFLNNDQTGLSKVFFVNIAADGESIFELDRSFVPAVTTGISTYVFMENEFHAGIRDCDSN